MILAKWKETGRQRQNEVKRSVGALISSSYLGENQIIDGSRKERFNYIFVSYIVTYKIIKIAWNGRELRSVKWAKLHIFHGRQSRVYPTVDKPNNRDIEYYLEF